MHHTSTQATSLNLITLMDKYIILLQVIEGSISTSGVSLTRTELDSSAQGSQLSSRDKYLVSFHSWYQFSTLVHATYYLAWNVDKQSTITDIGSDYLEPYRSVGLEPMYNNILQQTYHVS